MKEAVRVPIGSVNIYQVAQTCLIVPKIHPRGIRAYYRDGPFHIIALDQLDDSAVEAVARDMLRLSLASSNQPHPKYDAVAATTDFDGLMLGFATSLGIKVPTLARRVSLVFVSCMEDRATIERGERRRGKFAFAGVPGHETAVDLSRTAGFGGALATLLRSVL